MKIKKRLKSGMAMVLSIVLLVTSINLSAFASSGDYIYAGVGYESITLALEAIDEDDSSPTIYVTGNVNIDSSVIVNKSVTIAYNGNTAQEQATLQIGSDINAFTVNQGVQLTLQNIIINGQGADGTAYSSTVIENYGSIILNNTKIQNIKATRRPIYMENAILMMDEDSSINNNIGEINWTRTSGAIYTNGTCYISGGSFSNNSSNRAGGAINHCESFGENGTLYVTGVIFYENSAHQGGAIYGKATVIKDCIFDSNIAGYQGGAIYIASGSSLQLNNCSISGSNSALGGAVYVGKGTHTMCNVAIEECNADTGSAVYLSDGTLTISEKHGEVGDGDQEKLLEQSKITNCGTENSTGTIYVDKRATVIAEKLEISQNNAKDGGGIYNEGTIELRDVKINVNEANRGEGIYNKGSINLYGEAAINDRILLADCTKVNVKESLRRHINGQTAINVAILQTLVEHGGVIAQYDYDDNLEHAHADAYKDAIDNVWKLESVLLEEEYKVAASGNKIIQSDETYNQTICCVNNNGDLIEDVQFILYKIVEDENEKATEDYLDETASSDENEKSTTEVYLGETSYSNENGIIQIERLLKGNYKVRYNNVPAGYYYEELPETSYVFEIDNQDDEMTISVGTYNETPTAVITMEEHTPNEQNIINIARGEVLNMSASNSTDDNGITSYTWDFGDSTKLVKECEASHSYTYEGTYRIILTVKDEIGNTSSTDVMVNVTGTVEGYGMFCANIIASDTGEGITGAYIELYDENKGMLYCGTLETYQYVTYLPQGKNYSIVAWKEGYYIRTVSFFMETATKDINIYLSSSTTITGDLISTELDMVGIEAAGIDIENPENAKIVKYSLELKFIEAHEYSIYTFYYDHNSKTEYKGIESNGTFGNKKITIAAEEGRVYFLVVEGRTQWLKNMFDVQLIVYNNSVCENITDCNAELDLPEGLSFVDMEEGIENNPLKNIGIIEAGKSAVVHWYVRGDRDGVYNTNNDNTISAEVTGNMQENTHNSTTEDNTDGSDTMEGENEHGIKYIFLCSTPMEVISDGVLHCDIYIDGYTFTGDMYEIKFVYTNISSKDVNGLTFFFDHESQYSSDGDVFVNAELYDKYEHNVLKPGESVSVKFSTEIKFRDRNGNAIDAVLINAALSILEGSTSYMTHTVHVDWTPKELKYNTTLLSGFEPFIFDADPVDLLTGEFVHEMTDFTLNGKPDIQMTRYYYSGQTKDIGFGAGWSHNYDYELKVNTVEDEETKYIELTYPSGLKRDFYTVDEDRYSDGVATGRIIEKVYETNEDGTQSLAYYVLKELGKEYRFNTNGKLVRIINADLSATKITYNNGRINIISGRAGKMQFFWNEGTGHISKIVLNDTYVVKYGYADGELTSVVNADDDAMIYTYDGTKVISVTDYTGRKVVENIYEDICECEDEECICDEKSSRIVSQSVLGEGEYNFVYDDVARINTCYGPLGYMHSIEYDAKCNIIKDIQGESCAEGDSQKAEVVTFEYNGIGKVITSTNADGITKYSYDTSGNLSYVMYADNTTETYTYDEECRLIFYKNRNDKQEEYRYNNKGLLYKKIDFRGYGNHYFYGGSYYDLITENDQMGVVTQYEYNDAGLVTTVSDAYEGTTTYEYDDAGRVLSEEKADGYKKEYTYTPAGKLTKIIEAHNNGETITQEYEYDADGYVVSMKDGRGNITTCGYSYEQSETDGDISYDYNIKKVTTPEGNITTYAYDAMGNKISETDSEGSTTSYTYDFRGNVIKKTDALGDEWNYSYDKRGRLVEVINPYYGKNTYTYDVDGNVLTETDENGNVTSYTYDAMGNLLTEKDALGYVTEYIYDDNGNLTGIKDANGKTTWYIYTRNNKAISKVNTGVNVVTNTFDDAGRVIRSTNSDGTYVSYNYDDEGRLILMTDAENNDIKYTYDGRGNLTSTEYDDGGKIVYEYDENNNQISVKDERGLAEEYVYDKDNRLISVKDRNGNVTFYEYDCNNNVIKETDALNNETVYTYDALGQLKTQTTGEKTIRFEYDALGRVVKEITAEGNETTYTYDNDYHDGKNKMTKTDANGNITIYEYDELYRLKSITDSNGKITKYEYDGNGNVKKMWLPNGLTYLYTYNRFNKVVKEKDSNGNLRKWDYDVYGNVTLYTDTEGNVTQYEYDNNGNNIAIIDAYGNRQEMTYDARGRLTSLESAEGVEKSFEYDLAGNLVKETDGNGNETTYTYDNNGNMITMSLGGVVQEYTYDGLNRLKRIKYADDSSELYDYDMYGNVAQYTDRLGGVTEYTYDYDSNLISTKDALGNETLYDYDGKGNLIRITTRTLKDGIVHEEITEYEYDGKGNLTNKKDAMGKLFSYEYDEMDNLIRYADEEDNEMASYTYDMYGNVMSKSEYGSETATYSYDKNGNLLETITPYNIVEYARDSLGRIISTNVTVIQEDGNVNYTVGYSYDADGNKTGITYPDGSVVNYGYDGNGNITQITDESGTTTYTYDANDNKLTKTVNSVTQKYEYDVMGNLTRTSIVNEEAEEETLDIYTYGAGGLIQSHVETGLVTGEASHTIYGYDILGRLTQVNDITGNVTTTYSYDYAGNLIEETDGQTRTRYEYNALNQITESVTYRNEQGVDVAQKHVTYEYDTLGTLKRMYRSETNSYTYITGSNVDGQILGGINYYGDSNTDFAITTCRYNGIGEMVTETTQDVYDSKTYTRTFIYDYTEERTVVLAEYKTDGTVVKYRYGDDSERVNATISPQEEDDFEESSYTLDTDRVGSTRWALDSEREVASRTEYDTWGKTQEKTGIVVSSMKDAIYLSCSYAGYTNRDGFNMWNTGDRTYAPELRRFISEDPESGNLYEPIRTNRYIFAGDDPVNHVDVDGRCFDRLVPVFEAFSLVYDTMSAISNIVNSVYSTIPTELKFVIGTVGIVTATITGVGVGNILAITGGSIFSELAVNSALYALTTPFSDWSMSSYKDVVTTSVADGMLFAGITLGTVSISRAISEGKVQRFLADELGEFGGSKSGTTSTGYTYWSKSIQFDGNKVYQRNDLFDPKQVSSWKRNGKTVTGTNIERMAAGNAPIGYDGKSVNLHHLLQTPDGSIVEVSNSFHKQYYATIHMNTGKSPTLINRNEFNKWASKYWMNRSLDFQ